MLKIKITNSKTGNIIDERIVDEVDQHWLQSNIDAGSFGKKARWLQEPLDGVETRMVPCDDRYACELKDSCEALCKSWQVCASAKKEYLHPDEFVVVIEPYEIPYQELRKAEYEKEGITIDAMTVALFEKLGENRPDAFDALMIKKINIKNRISKR